MEQQQHQQQHNNNNDDDGNKCGLWSRSAASLSSSMEGISDLLKALSDEMDQDFDDVVVGTPIPVPSVRVLEDDHHHHRIVTAVSDVVVGGSDEEEEEEEDHGVTRGHHCQTRSSAGSGAGTRTEKRGIRDHRLRHRNRTIEMHNLTERRRREKIKWKLRELQQLVPNSNNMDRASMLEEAIRYMKSLQQEVKALSTGGLGVLCQTPPPYMQPLPAVQYMRLTGYPLFVPMNIDMDVGMNMVGLNCITMAMNSSTMAPLEPTRLTPSTGLLPMVDPAQLIRFFAPPALPTTSFPSPAEISPNNQVGHLIHSAKG